MKKTLSIMLFSAAVLGGSLAFAQSSEAAMIYRVYNPNSGEHHYTSNTGERDNLVKVGWANEGEAWDAPDEGTPVYRLYNPNTGDHHYTMDAGEKDNLVKVGWSDEGVAWQSDTKKEVPIYRLYNPHANTGSHHYTYSQAEVDSLKKAGWSYEGIAFYGQAKPEQTDQMIVKDAGKYGRAIYKAVTGATDEQINNSQLYKPEDFDGVAIANSKGWFRTLGYDQDSVTSYLVYQSGDKLLATAYFIDSGKVVNQIFVLEITDQNNAKIISTKDADKL